MATPPLTFAHAQSFDLCRGMQTTVSALSTPARCISSERLLAGERELVIEHMGSQYHLRLTRNGKLILTK